MTQPPISECLEAYWDNQRFSESLIDAPERMQAVFDVLADVIEHRGDTKQDLDPGETSDWLRELGKLDG